MVAKVASIALLPVGRRSPQVDHRGNFIVIGRWGDVSLGKECVVSEWRREGGKGVAEAVWVTCCHCAVGEGHDGDAVVGCKNVFFFSKCGSL